MIAPLKLQKEFASHPPPGKYAIVAPGVTWLRMVLPFSLSHINLWILEDGETWSIIDTGVSTEECRSIWQDTFDQVLDNRSVGRVFVTHLHPDHIGCAGWLTRKFGAPLWMTREEYLLARILVADTGRLTPAAGDRFYLGAGFKSDQLDYYHKMFGMFGKFVDPLPESFRRIQNDDRIDIGGNEWQIIVGRGHSPEHACFYCEQLNLLISGDQLLPTISSNVSVFPTEPDANPLAEWIESLKHLKQNIPADVLVLPAHGNPFRGAHPRLDQLITEHLDDLDRLVEYCREPKRAVDAFSILFRSRIDNNNLIMATGESIAHLNYLINTGDIEVHRDQHGVNWYTSR